MTKIIKCEHCPSNEPANEELIRKILPKGFDYWVCSYQTLGEGSSFKLNLNLRIKTEKEINQWVKLFEEESFCTYRISRTYPHVREKHKKLEFRVDLRCQHGTRTKPSEHPRKSKSTKCPSILKIILMKDWASQKMGPYSIFDPHLPDGRFFLEIDFNHNHPVVPQNARSHQEVSQAVADKMLELFRRGYSPSKALELHKYDLQAEYGDLKSVSRSVCPDLQYCFRLYYKAFKKKYGEPKEEQLVKRLQDRCNEYNSSVGYICSKVAVVGEDIALAVVTPLMKRVHEHLKFSGELVFIDSFGNTDRQGCHVFLLVTHCSIGSLPLGVCVTTSKNTNVIAQALNQYNQLLDEKAYFGRGILLGPQIVMTNDGTNEREALQMIYPESCLFPAVFHLLQSFWRFLWDSKNGVKEDDRSSILKHVKCMFYSDSIEKLTNVYAATQANPLFIHYKHVMKHVEEFYAKRKEWALCYNEKVRGRCCITNNYAEEGMSALKDKLLDCIRTYNILQSVDFVITRIEPYFVKRLLHILNNRPDQASQARFFPHFKVDDKADLEKIISTGESTFLVPSEAQCDVTETVDMSIGSCTCRLGKIGGPCKHQYLVIKKFGLPFWNFNLITDSVEQKIMYYIATGNTSFPSKNLSESVNVPTATAMDVVEMHWDDSHQTRIVANPGIQFQFLDQTSDVLLNDFKKVLDDIIHRYKEDPKYFEKSFEFFIQQSKSLSTNSALASALMNFGKYSPNK